MHFYRSKHMDTGQAVTFHAVTKVVRNITITD